MRYDEATERAILQDMIEGFSDIKISDLRGIKLGSILVRRRRNQWKIYEATREDHGQYKHPSNSVDVYFVQAVDGGPVKIGATIGVESRLISIQNGNPYKLRVVATISGGGFDLEHALHVFFADHRMCGEWFEWCDEIAVLIENLPRLPDAVLALAKYPRKYKLKSAVKCE